jgi:uncharacterized protein (DUF2141 family)
MATSDRGISHQEMAKRRVEYLSVKSILASTALSLFATLSGPALAESPNPCAASDKGPVLAVIVTGLKDRKGRLRAELFPNNDTDFLADNDVLVKAGKPFRRVDLELPRTNGTILCMVTPPPGIYALSVLHDRDLNLKFGFMSDGVGFAGNPKLARSKPKVAQARINISAGMNRVTIVLNYLRGFSFSPLGQ